MTNSKSAVRITTRTTGQNFGTVGVAKARNGRVVFTTDAFPLGFTDAARSSAEEWAAKEGRSVIA